MADSFTTERIKAHINPTYATPSTGVVYQVYPQYAELKRVCGNCKHSQETPTETWCLNLDTESFIEGGMNKPILKPAEWSCPLWEAKEGEGQGG